MDINAIQSDHAHRRFIKALVNWRHKEISLAITWALLLFVLSLLINYLAGIYASSRASAAVNDIILDNLPTFDVDGIFVYSFFVLFFAIAGVLVWRPHNAPFVIKSLSLFIVVRSFFVCLTHIGPLPQAAIISPDSIVNLFTFTGDLFFSGHTGLPFLMALIFWQNIYLSKIFLGFSIFLGVIVLLGHLHYSIDVFAAFFITYGIYHIALRLFKKDYGRLKI